MPARGTDRGGVRSQSIGVASLKWQHNYKRRPAPAAHGPRGVPRTRSTDVCFVRPPRRPSSAPPRRGSILRELLKAPMCCRSLALCLSACSYLTCRATRAAVVFPGTDNAIVLSWKGPDPVAGWLMLGTRLTLSMFKAIHILSRL